MAVERMGLQDGARHDAEGALAADQELRPVEAGIVLVERRDAADHRAVGQHRLEPQDEAAGHAVAQNVRAAGIGRDDTADGGRAAGAEGDGQVAADRAQGIAHGVDDGAGLDGDAETDAVDGEDAVHPLEAEEEVAAGPIGRRARGEAGAAALGNEAEPVLAGERDHRDDVVCRGRAGDREGAAMKASRPVFQMGLHPGRVGDDTPVAEDRPQVSQDTCLVHAPPPSSRSGRRANEARWPAAARCRHPQAYQIPGPLHQSMFRKTSPR